MVNGKNHYFVHALVAKATEHSMRHNFRIDILVQLKMHQSYGDSCIKIDCWQFFYRISDNNDFPSAAQPENNNGTNTFNGHLPTTSDRKKPEEPIFRGPFSQLYVGRIAALILEENITALNNMCMRSFFGSPHSPPINFLPMKRRSHW